MIEYTETVDGMAVRFETDNSYVFAVKVLNFKLEQSGTFLSYCTTANQDLLYSAQHVVLC